MPGVMIRDSMTNDVALIHNIDNPVPASETAWVRWDQDADSVTMTYNGTSTGQTVWTLSMATIRADLTHLQRSWDELHFRSDSRWSQTLLPPVGLRGKGELWLALNHQLMRNPSMRIADDVVLSVMELDEWKDQRATFERNGYEINQLTGAFHHTLYITIEGSNVTRISEIEEQGSEPFDMYYYTIDHDELGGDPLAHLLPRLLTGTNFVDGRICFVYARLVRRNPFVPDLPYEHRVSKASYALVNRPMVLCDMLQYNSDSGRDSVMADRVQAALFERQSAAISRRCLTQREAGPSLCGTAAAPSGAAAVASAVPACWTLSARSVAATSCKTPCSTPLRITWHTSRRASSRQWTGGGRRRFSPRSRWKWRPGCTRQSRTKRTRIARRPTRRSPTGGSASTMPSSRRSDRSSRPKSSAAACRPCRPALPLRRQTGAHTPA